MTMFLPLKHQRLEAPFCEENLDTYVHELNMQSLGFSDILEIGNEFDCTTISESLPPVIPPINDLPATKMPAHAIAEVSSTPIFTITCDDYATYSSDS